MAKAYNMIANKKFKAQKGATSDVLSVKVGSLG